MRLGPEHATQERGDVLGSPAPRLRVAPDGGPPGEAIAPVLARARGALA